MPSSFLHPPRASPSSASKRHQQQSSTMKIATMRFNRSLSLRASPASPPSRSTSMQPARSVPSIAISSSTCAVRCLPIFPSPSLPSPHGAVGIAGSTIFPSDEAVPMMFRMEPDRRRAPPSVEDFQIREPLCRTSTGVSTDEPWPSTPRRQTHLRLPRPRLAQQSARRSCSETPMRTRLFAIAALVAAVLLSPIGNVEACGPVV